MVGRALIKLCVLIPAGAILGPASAAPHVAPGHQLLRVTVSDTAQLETLLDLDAKRRDIEVWADRPVPGTLDVRASLAAKHALADAGLTFDVAIPDLQAYYTDIFPGGDGDFFDVYRTYEEHAAFMQELADAFPMLAQRISVGRSVEGRELWTLRITGPGDEKVGAMYHGSQHGNEITGAAVVAYTARHLLENYGIDSELTALVDNVEWFLLPIMNPDGYVHGNRYNANGADLNRNWGGPATNSRAFNQPETLAMADFFLTHPNVRGHMDFHAFGRMILWPWGHTPELCPHQSMFKDVGERMALRIAEVRGTDYGRRGPIYTTIYPVVGGEVDYLYGDLGKWSFAIEIGYGYAEPDREILPSCQELTAGLIALSNWLYDCNGNGLVDQQEIDSGHAEDCNGNRTPDECELLPDFDSDSVIDPCDQDTDDDGVLNESDVCPFTPLGAPISADGRSFGDTNENCATDDVDFGRFWPCWSSGGPGTSAAPWPCRSYFDFDGDGDVDLADAATFQLAFAPSLP